jgi:hypothetical protein
MIKKLLLTLVGLLITLPCYAAVTIIWEHDCVNTLGFRTYYGSQSGQNNVLLATVPCPQTRVTITNEIEGYYIVKAYNDVGESDPSNEVLFAEYYYNTIRYEYGSTGLVLYKGEHPVQNVSESDSNWTITKYFYTNGFITHVRIRTTSWTNRAIGW